MAPSRAGLHSRLRLTRGGINLLIALDSEASLMELGASEVHVASGVDSAQRILAGKRIGFAILDLNLGSETSIPVADRLLEQSAPFIFAMGYGDADVLPRPAPVAAGVEQTLHDLGSAPAGGSADDGDAHRLIVRAGYRPVRIRSTSCRTVGINPLL